MENQGTFTNQHLGEKMPAPWEAAEMREWADRFLEEERRSGRTYSMVVTGTRHRPGVSETSYSLVSSEPPVDQNQFRRLVTSFMERNNWDRDGGIGPWVETFEMAVMTYIRDVLQAA